jgi:hypothetical protein
MSGNQHGRRSRTDSDPHANLAYELAKHAQELVLCMASLSAFAEANHPIGVPTTPKGFMVSLSTAVYEDMSNPKEMNPLEW